MEEPKLRYKNKASLISEADLAGMVFNTPVPFFDVGVSCGDPRDTGDVVKLMLMMPDEIVGPYGTYCTRAEGDSMKDLGIMTGDLLVIEVVPEYHSYDIVLAEIDGERLLKTYYVTDNGEQWLVPANSKYKSRKLDASMNIVFKGRLKHHLRRAPVDSVHHIMETIEDAREQMAAEQAQSEEFKRLVVSPECADKVISRLHVLMEDKLKPRDLLMPLRAAMEAGAIRRPTWAEFIAEFGCKCTSKASLSGYTDPTKDKYSDEPQFWVMVDDFRRLISR